MIYVVLLFIHIKRHALLVDKGGDAGLKPNHACWPNRSEFYMIFFEPWISLSKYGLRSLRKTSTQFPPVGPIFLVLITWPSETQTII